MYSNNAQGEDESREVEDLYESLGRPPPGSGSDTEEHPAPSPAELVSLARRFHRRLRVLLNESLEATGISYAQFEVLETVHGDRNQHAGSIAGELGITRQSANELVRRLEAAGFVARLAPDTGVRGVLLTKEGEAQLERCTQAIEPFLMLFGRMTPDARRSFQARPERGAGGPQAACAVVSCL